MLLLASWKDSSLMRDALARGKDTDLDKPFSKQNALAVRHWSRKHQHIVFGINLITLLWTDGETLPFNYRIFDREIDGKLNTTIFRKCSSSLTIEDLNRLCLF